MLGAEGLVSGARRGRSMCSRLFTSQSSWQKAFLAGSSFLFSSVFLSCKSGAAVTHQPCHLQSKVAELCSLQGGLGWQAKSPVPSFALVAEVAVFMYMGHLVGALRWALGLAPTRGGAGGSQKGQQQ